MGSIEESLTMENGIEEWKDRQYIHKTPQNLSTSLLRIKSDPAIVSGVRFQIIRQIFVDFQQVILGTKLCVLLPAVPFAILAHCFHFSRAWVFALSFVGLAPLAERVSFLTEQIAYFTGPTVGGLLNATCGNATELIIALLALCERKIDVVKYSLLGSILSNLLLVLGSSLLCGGLANLKREQRFDKRQADVNSILLLLGLLCHVVPLMCKHGMESTDYNVDSVLMLSRAISIFMLFGYLIYIYYHLVTHRQLYQSQQEDEGENSDDDDDDDGPLIGFWSALIWLVTMTTVIGVLSQYVVGTIEVASDSWGISVGFISLILLPIVGNAAEHAGAIIFAFKNKLDISLGVALGSAAQISMFVVPLCVIVAWTMGIHMDLDFKLLQTGCLAFSIVITAFTLQDGNSHYMKGVVLCLSYLVIAIFFLFHKQTNSTPTPLNKFGIHFTEQLDIEQRSMRVG